MHKVFSLFAGVLLLTACQLPATQSTPVLTWPTPQPTPILTAPKIVFEVGQLPAGAVPDWSRLTAIEFETNHAWCTAIVHEYAWLNFGTGGQQIITEVTAPSCTVR